MQESAKMIQSKEEEEEDDDENDECLEEKAKKFWKNCDIL